MGEDGMKIEDGSSPQHKCLWYKIPIKFLNAFFKKTHEEPCGGGDNATSYSPSSSSYYYYYAIRAILIR